LAFPSGTELFVIRVRPGKYHICRTLSGHARTGTSRERTHNIGLRDDCRLDARLRVKHVEHSLRSRRKLTNHSWSHIGCGTGRLLKGLRDNGQRTTIVKHRPGKEWGGRDDEKT
jgi:hypothetical protein